MQRPHPRDILRVLEQRARRRFGQHFLWRDDIVARIVRSARLSPGDPVVEVGPGLGILTHALVGTEARVKAVELDRDLAEYVRAQFADVDVVEADATKVRWSEVCPGSGWSVVANLPYNVGTTVVMQMLAHPETFGRVTVMLQREVVDRLLGMPGTKAYGALSVQAQVRAKGRFVLLVPPDAFYPPPKVQSAVVQLEPYPEPRCGPAGIEAFDRVVKAAFSQRRKTLLNSLTPLYGRDAARAGLDAAGIDPGLRAEVLTVEQFAALAAALHVPAGAGDDPAR